MSRANPGGPTGQWIFAVLAILIVVGIAVNLTISGPYTLAKSSATARPQISADAAVRAAQRILAESATPKADLPADRMNGALTAANAVLGSFVFGSAASVSRQVLNVSVNADGWNALTEADKNALSAAIASTWATLWQQAHPHGSLEEGTIVRIIDQKGNEIRRDVFRRP